MTIIVIPARFNASRFPGKPLSMINGRSMIYRTWRLAKAVARIDEVYIATDDTRIEQHAIEFGAKVIMTPKDCCNGSERVLQAVQCLPQPPEWVVNLQADAVITPPGMIQALVDAMLADAGIEVGTIASKLSLEHYQAMWQSKRNAHVGPTMVVFDRKQNALYFSKSMLPFVRNKIADPVWLYRHIGLYAYRYSALVSYQQLAPSPLEKIEGLEQLRFLENGLLIRVILVDYPGWTPCSIDNPADIAMAERIIQQEGELVL